MASAAQTAAYKAQGGVGDTPIGFRTDLAGSNDTNTSAGNSMQNYLNTYQQQSSQYRNAAEANIFKSDAQIQSEIKTNVVPTTAAPVAPNMTELFSTLRSDQGVSDLESNLNNIKSIERDVQANSRQRIQAQLDKPVAMNVIGGRTSEVQRQEQETLDFLGRQKEYINDELTTRYKVIDTIMSLTNTDYQNAFQQYNTQFNQNLQMYSLFRQAKTEQTSYLTEQANRAEDKAFTVSNTIASWEREDKQRQEDAARSNLQVYANLITSGNLKLSSLPGDSKAAITKLEVQSGLGVGFLSSVMQKAGAAGSSVMHWDTHTDGSGTKYVDAIVKQADGSFKVVSQQLGNDVGNMPEVQKQNQATQLVADRLGTNTGKDGFVSPDTYNTYKKTWVDSGYDPLKYDKQFETYRNPKTGGYQVAESLKKNANDPFAQ